MKNLLSWLLLAGTIAFASCKKEEGQPANTARVMFVNGCASGADNAISVNVGNTTVNNGSNLNFLGSTGYQNVPAGQNTASFKVSGLGTALASGNVNFAVNQTYSVFLGGIINAPVFVYAPDDLAPPATGAKVRFVNLSADNITTDCYVGNLKVDSNRTYTSVGAFVNIPAGSANVLMLDVTKPTMQGQLNAYNFMSGKIYTVMFTGLSTATGNSALRLTVLTHN